jgi:hypothetical protein
LRDGLVERRADTTARRIINTFITKKGISSHPEKTFPDENTQLLAIIYGQKPFEKGFWRELHVEIQVFPSGNSNFRRETN